MKRHSLITLLCLCTTISAFLSSCDDDDDNKKFDGRSLWSKTMAGNDIEEIAWPDRSENYWEYTMDVTENPNIGIKFKGEYPRNDVRFFNFTFYNDVSTQRITSIEDFNIIPNEGSSNPFTAESNGKASERNYFEINMVPAGTSATVRNKLSNVLEFSDNIKKLSVLLRIYFNSDEHGTDFGGVALPEIVFFNTTTGEELGTANRTDSRYYAMCKLIASQIPTISVQERMPFTLAPDVMYSNGPTGYVTSSNRVDAESVLAFRFIPPGYPKTIAENRNANVRYWSICVGDAKKTITPITIPDTKAKESEDGYVNFWVVDQNNLKMKELKEKAEAMKINLIVWDSKAYGDALMLFYRQMHIKNDYEYSVRNIPYYPPLGANGLPDTSKPIKPENMAHVTLGEHGPSGVRLSVDKVLSSEFGYKDMRWN